VENLFAKATPLFNAKANSANSQPNDKPEDDVVDATYTETPNA
jgi:hypothetical protein